MEVEQIYTQCLAQGSYYIESNGVVAIIDPLRDTDAYIDKAKQRHAKIKYILETHFHADFVSGHVELAQKTGAEIVYGTGANPAFPCLILKDGETLSIGNLTLVALHTPGHTLESTCYLLKNEEGKNYALFSGDTLFLGDVGRPDLAQKAGHLMQEDLAGMLYESLHSKIMPLEDDIIVYPGHGAGSACGQHMIKKTVDTLGAQKQSNHALRIDMTKEEFIKTITTGLMPPPKYFKENVLLNKTHCKNLEAITHQCFVPLTAEKIKKIADQPDTLVLDTRSPHSFAQKHIPNAINIGIDGDFAPWVGALIPYKKSIVLVVESGRELEAIKRLARVGYENVIGYLEGGIEAWENAGYAIDMIKTISANELAVIMNKKNINLIVADVRKPSEYQTGHVEGSINLPLDFIHDNWQDFPVDQTCYIHCAGGYRSMIASSILKAYGKHNFVEIEGGHVAIAKTSIRSTTPLATAIS